MAETADVLARPAVTVEIKRLIVRAMRDGGISQTHATRVGLAMADRIFGGEPVAEAIALVDTIRDAIAADVAGMKSVNFHPNDGTSTVEENPVDGIWIARGETIRRIRGVDDFGNPARENGGAGEAGGLLNA